MSNGQIQQRIIPDVTRILQECPTLNVTVALGIDANRAHTQGRGTYHYHGLPTGLLWALRAAAPDRPVQLAPFHAALVRTHR